MSTKPDPRDIEFVIARGEALVSHARGMVAQWEQSLVQLGITPEMARQLQQGEGPPDLQAQIRSQAPAGHGNDSGSPVPGPSLPSARRALRRLRHI